MNPKFKGFTVAKNNVAVKLVIGIIFAVLVLVIGLGSIVVIDNKTACNKIGLDGFIADTCFAKSGKKFDEIAIVTGNTANVPEPAITKDTQGYIAASLIQEKSKINVYSVTPDSKKYTVKTEMKGNINLKKRVEAVKEKIEEVEDVMQTSPTTSGARYLETIIKAANNMRLSDNEKGVIVVTGSGLSDGGYLDFPGKDYLHADPEKLAELLADERQGVLGGKDILENITIVWSGIGEVVSPQSSLSEREKENLSAIYETIIVDKMGADDFITDSSTSGNKSVDTNYEVKTVKTNGPPSPPGPTKLNIDFENDSAEIKKGEEEKIEADLKEIIEYVELFKDKVILVEGYVGLANCNSNADVGLSERRAETVKQLLMRRGISESRIEAVGRGKGSIDECKNGNYDEGLSNKNKYVEVTVK